jgi:hypothetical protein
MEKKLYFEKPTQVAFWDDGLEKYVGGIAYQDEIICGCCGGVLSIEELYEDAPPDRIPVYSYPIWSDLSVDIAGDYFPTKEEEAEWMKQNQKED